MSELAFEIVLILLLILLNGVFALAEIAVISARRVRLQQRAESGDRGARVALELATEPTNFLSTVQIGITLVGILAGAYGGARISENISTAVARIPVLEPHADMVGFGLVVLAITYLSLVVGELLPKRLALGNPERIAAIMARPMRALSKVASPLVGVLSFSTNVLIRIMGIRPGKESPVTAEEINILLQQGESAGIFEPVEQDIVENALRLDDLKVSGIMTPRTEVEALDIDAGDDEVVAAIIESPHGWFPVVKGDPDNVVGVARGRDLLIHRVAGRGLDYEGVIHPPTFVPRSQSALRVLEQMKQSGAHMAIVIDEFGGLLGIVTLTDIMEALVGQIRAPGMPADPMVVAREDGSMLLDGRLTLHHLRDLLDVNELPKEEEGGYETLGGWIMVMLGRIPAEGDAFDFAGRRIEVLKMDGKRVDRVVVPRRPVSRRGADTSPGTN
jgi:putative hemolysin